MRCQNSVFIYCIVAALVAFALCFEMHSTELGLEQAIEEQLNKEQLAAECPNNSISDRNADRFLRRKRRYLEFPDGSSFQLVYDLIVGVVDYTNYLILGITVALAWELPSKPPSEILEDLNERLRDGTLGTSRNDTIEKIQYTEQSTPTASPHKINYQTNLQPVFRPPMHYQYYTHPTPDNFYKYTNRKPLPAFKFNTPNRYGNWSGVHDKWYATKHLAPPSAKWPATKKNYKFGGPSIKYPWWNLPQRLKSSFAKRPSVRRFDENNAYSSAALKYKRPTKAYATYRNTARSDHRIYPVFGKRSTTPRQTHNESLPSHHFRYRRNGITTAHLSKWDRIHIEHHRRTRHDLYEHIETYLNGRGSHGHHCVLRALCETGQKSHEHIPGSFVGELMRAVFTLPEPLVATAAKGHQQIGYKELRYDAANALKDDCAKRYNHCKDSLWSSHFVL